MIQTTIEIQNKLGLHARASAKLIKEASRFASKIVLITDTGKEVDAKDILEVMTLAAKQGTSLTLQADGEDEHDALEAISALIDDKFGEDQDDE